MKQVDTKNSRYNASVGHEVRGRAARCQATASLWTQHFTYKRVMATLGTFIAITRTGGTRPTNEVLGLNPSPRQRQPAPQIHNQC